MLFPLYENKSAENQMYLETVAEFLHVLLNQPNFKTDIIKNMKRNIYEIYMGNVIYCLFRISSSAQKIRLITGNTSSTAILKATIY